MSKQVLKKSFKKSLMGQKKISAACAETKILRDLRRKDELSSSYSRKTQKTGFLNKVVRIFIIAWLKHNSPQFNYWSKKKEVTPAVHLELLKRYSFRDFLCCFSFSDHFTFFNIDAQYCCNACGCSLFFYFHLQGVLSLLGEEKLLIC